ncbi:MAG TPA: hypothetical protein VKM72_06145 [Thermoanaerobaculia bacterium]|nr:hypothetical protein [Thermoanaerobaculia bacterium]
MRLDFPLGHDHGERLARGEDRSDPDGSDLPDPAGDRRADRAQLEIALQAAHGGPGLARLAGQKSELAIERVSSTAAWDAWPRSASS